MNTPTNAYLTRTFSISVLLMLAFSGTLFVLPLTAPAHAANSSLPSISLSDNVLLSGGPTTVAITVSNPTSNSYEITGLTIQAPANWAFTNGANTGFHSNYGCSATAGSVVCTLALPPGASLSTTSFLPVTPQAPSTVNAVVGTFTSTVQDQSSSAFYVGPNTKAYSVGATGLTFTSTAFAVGSNCVGNTFTAGSGTCTASASLQNTGSLGIAGVPVVWSVTSAQGSVSPASGVTDSTGKVSTTLTPSNVAGPAATTYTANLGTSSQTIGTQTVATTAAAPVSATFQLGGAFPASATHYIGGANNAPPPNGGTGPNDATITGSSIAISATDKFGNPIDLGAVTGLTVSVSTTAAGGVFNNAGNKTTITKLAGDITVGASPSYTAVIADAYFQLGTYRSTDVLTGTLSGTTPSFTVSGSSGALVTSTFSTASPGAASITEFTGDCTPATCAAGSTVGLHAVLGTPQRGVPIIFYLDTATSTQVNGDGTMMVSTTTGTNGSAVASLKLDTGAGATLKFLTQLSDAAQTSGNLGNGTDSSTVFTTVAGAPASISLQTYFDSALALPTTHAVNGSQLYVDITLADKYGNPTTNTFNYQIQIALSGPGKFSATNVYISSGCSDTAGVTSLCASAFGPILWTAPNAFATETLVATSSFQTTTDKVTLVSAVPTLAVTSPKPLSGVIYAGSTAVTFQGQANVSLGYPSTSKIVAMGFSVDGGHWQSASVGSNNQLVWAISVFLAAGIHTIQFNATDDTAAANTVVSQKFTVLVDSAAPDVNFVTANNANISSPATVSASVVDSMGDLNATSVSAVATNIATSATKTLTASVTGTNNPGHSVSYAVSLSGLTTGNWSVALSASDLAGNSNSSTITVHVTVPFAQSFAISGTPAASTLGSYAGISVTYINQNPTSQSVVVFAVFKNGAGQTVGIGTGSATFAAGATQSVFIADPLGLASGAYSVSIFVFTSGNLPVSVTTPISVTV